MTGRKWIAVAGDGSQHAYQFSSSPTSWNFARQTLVDTKATVGQLAVEDVDNVSNATIAS